MESTKELVLFSGLGSLLPRTLSDSLAAGTASHNPCCLQWLGPHGQRVGQRGGKLRLAQYQPHLLLAGSFNPMTSEIVGSFRNSMASFSAAFSAESAVCAIASSSLGMASTLPKATAA